MGDAHEWSSVYHPAIVMLQSWASRKTIASVEGGKIVSGSNLSFFIGGGRMGFRYKITNKMKKCKRQRDGVNLSDVNSRWKNE